MKRRKTTRTGHQNGSALPPCVDTGLVARRCVRVFTDPITLLTFHSHSLHANLPIGHTPRLLQHDAALQSVPHRGNGGKSQPCSPACSRSPQSLIMLLGACLAASRTASALARHRRNRAGRPGANRAASAPRRMLSTQDSQSAGEQDAPLGFEGRRLPAAADGEQMPAAALTIHDLPDDLLGQIFVTAVPSRPAGASGQQVCLMSAAVPHVPICSPLPALPLCPACAAG